MGFEVLDKIYEFNSVFTGDSEKVFDYKTGSVPILISSPHSASVTKKKYQKPAEYYTGALNLYLNEVSGTHALYALNLDYRDPNRDLNCTYKQFLKETVSKYGIKYIIDLHGASSSRPFAIDLGTSNTQSIDSSIVRRITEAFLESGVTPVFENYMFKATRSTCVTKFITSTVPDVEAIQIEVNRLYRDPLRNPEQFIQLVNSLQTIILSMERVLTDGYNLSCSVH